MMKKTMNFVKFIKSDIAKQLRFQRFAYVVSPVSNEILEYMALRLSKQESASAISIQECDVTRHIRIAG